MAARSESGDAAYSTLGVGAADLERYQAVSLESGAVVVYDRDDEDAWIQSKSGIRLEFMR